VNNKLRWGLSAVALASLVVVIAVLVIQRNQHRQERELIAPEQLQQRLSAVQAADVGLLATDLDMDRLRQQEEERIRQMLARDLAQTNHPDPASAVALLMPAALSLVSTQEGLLADLERRLRSLPEEEWQRTVLSTDHWKLSVEDICLELRNLSETDSNWRWISISQCDAD
jgi:hypothetical protein